jgi:O-antigen/teichoic acid export membrane protein
MTARLRFEGIRSVIANSSALVGATAMTSALGFVYWWLAARVFMPEAVGFASAAIAAMTLLGTIATLGFGTLLIGELPRHPGREASLLGAGVLAASGMGAGLGILFALVAPAVVTDFAPLRLSIGTTSLFALGAAMTAGAMVLDQALIGMNRGGWQFIRNTVFATAKLGALVAASRWVSDRSGLMVYATWALGNLLSLALATCLLARCRGYGPLAPLAWHGIRRLARAALGHHALYLSLQFPTLVLPVVVTAVLSATTNAYFYAAAMIANLVYAGPAALTIALYAAGSRAPATLGRITRFTLILGFLVGAAANVVLLVGSDTLLRAFGPAYAVHAAWPLRIIGLAVFPIIIKDHFIAVSRVRGDIGSATAFVAFGGIVEVVGAMIGARVAGLEGLTVGWLIGTCVEASCMARRVRQATAQVIEVHTPGPKSQWIGPGRRPSLWGDRIKATSRDTADRARLADRPPATHQTSSRASQFPSVRCTRARRAAAGTAPVSHASRRS